MANKSLEEIAREAHAKHMNELNQAKANDNTPTNEPASSEEETSEEAGTVITDDDLDVEEAQTIIQQAEQSQANPDVAKKDESIRMITKDDIASLMPDMEASVRTRQADAILKRMQEYRNRLITEEGMTPEEATKAVQSRTKRETKALNDKWLDDHPHTGVITIEKGKEDQLQLTEEEHQKLVSTNVIELHLVTSEDLKHTKLASVPESGSKLDYIRTLNSMAARTVAMPALGDTATFRSATSAEIIRSGISLETKSPLESIDKLSTFLYDHFMQCHTFSKYDDKNAVTLSYQDFCDKFPFFEIPMAEYAIYSASSPEYLTIDLSCNRCRRPFKWDMHPDKMLSIKDFDENSRKEFDAIHAHFNDVEWLTKHSDEKMQATIMESPISKNRFVVQTPSISRAKQVMQAADNLHLYDVDEGSDEADLNTTVIACAMMLNSLYIYSDKDKGYIYFGPDEIEDVLRFLPSLPNEDFRMINQFSLDYYYSPAFSSGPITCPNCKHEIEFTPTADQLLFLYAREEFRIQ